MRELKITKLKGGYSANATLIFNSCLKDIEMCDLKRKIPHGEAIQLVKDCTSDQARNAVEFYLDMTLLDHQHYYDLIGHLTVAFQTLETFNLVVSDFYSCEQKGKGSEDNFGDELQVLPIR